MSLLHTTSLLGYIDPGSGAMLLQWVIAGIAGVGFYFRRFLRKAFRRLLGKKDDPDDSQESTEK